MKLLKTTFFISMLIIYSCSPIYKHAGGFVIDNETKQPITNATYSIDGEEEQIDSTGKFNLMTYQCKQRVKIQAIGYQPKIVRLKCNTSKKIRLTKEK